MESVYDTLRRPSEAVWQKLHTHPFVREMAEGVLPPRKFAFYIQQNLLYLKEFARMYSIGVARAEDEATMIEFAHQTASVLEFELPKNRELLERVLALEPAAERQMRMAPANLAYTSHLLRVAYSGGVAEILAATLPCTVSYGEIGRELAGSAIDHPVYKEWIGFFASQEYWAVVDAAHTQFERVCAGLGPADLGRLAVLFETSSLLELGFWDMAYSEQGWSV